MIYLYNRCRGGHCRRLAATAILSAAIAACAVAQDENATQPDPQAADLFRNAVALQNRALYDLAADEWADLLRRYPEDPLATRARHYHGVCLFQLRKYADAAEEFERVLRRERDFESLEEVYANLGLARYNQAVASETAADQADHFRQLAIGALSEQLRRFPQGPLAPQSHYYLAEALYGQKQLAEAIAHYGKFVGDYREDKLRPQALYGLGVTEQELQKHADADRTFDRFLNDYPQHALHTEVILRRGEVLLALGKAAEAEQQFARAAAVPNFADADYALERQAACRYATQNYTGAAALYQLLTSRFPQSELAPQAALAAGKCFFLADQLPQAIEWLQRSQVHGEKSGEAAHWLARAHLRSGKPEQALRIVTDALAQQPTDAMKGELKFDLADALYEQPSRRAEAVAAYAELARTDAAHELAPQAAYMAAYAALEAGDHAAALDHAEYYLDHFADKQHRADVEYVAAEAQLQLGQHADAARRFEQLLSQFPEHKRHDAWLVRKAVSQSLAGNWPAVVNTLETEHAQLSAVDLRSQAGLLLGKAYSALGQFSAAVEVLSKLEFVARDWDQADEVMFHLAHARQSTGDPAAAADYRAVFTRWPQSPLAARAMLALARLQASTLDYNAARETVDELIGQHGDDPATAPAYLVRATVRHHLGIYNGAIEDVEAFLATQPPRSARSDALYVRGLCEAALERPADAIATFRSILKDDPQYHAADRVTYELAWATKATDGDRATALFRQLAERHPQSPLAAECWYRVGEAQLASGDAQGAATSFAAAEEQTADEALREKAVHKLAWAHFQAGQHQQAAQQFQRQLDEFAQGELAIDAQLMIAELLFQEEAFDKALAAFETALAGTTRNQSLAELSLLHAGQAAAQLDEWEKSLDLLDRFLQKHSASPSAGEARYEKGWALYNLKRFDEAQPLFEQVAQSDRSILGARALFMLGEIAFANKQYDDAVRTFFKVAYGYGDRQAPEEFHHWQAEAMFEAARCLQQTGRAESARKLYRELIERFPKSDKADLAKEQIQ